jgi:hypothetical protein
MVGADVHAPRHLRSRRPRPAVGCVRTATWQRPGDAEAISPEKAAPPSGFLPLGPPAQGAVPSLDSHGEDSQRCGSFTIPWFLHQVRTVNLPRVGDTLDRRWPNRTPDPLRGGRECRNL